jgi:4-amino-4-deoxy-L-arabinose transferase-like glycosyltransferase
MSGYTAFLSQPRGQLGAFLLLLGLCLAPALPRLSRYHGDECYYTDAAIRMAQTGDYWTPRYPDGSVRLVKPVATYWTLVVAYRSLGISFFSSRLPFLLAAGAIVWLTYRLGLRLWGNPSAALLGALIAGCNTQFFALALRSTPDALVCLFVLMSLSGFARILFNGDRSWVACALAYVGAGLAVQTKGLLGLAPVAFAFLFATVSSRPGARPRDLFEWRAIGVGSVVALFWYAIVFALHGRQILVQFFSDQITAKVAFTPVSFLANLGVYVLAMARHFLPWTLLLVAGGMVSRRATVDFLREHRREAFFLAGWFLLLAVLFSFGTMRRTRYLAAAYPSLAVLFAGLLARYLEGDRFQKVFAGILRGAVPVLLALALFMAFQATRLDSLLVLGAGVLLAIAAGIHHVARTRTRSVYGLALAGLCVVGFGVVENFCRPLFSVVPATGLAKRLLEHNPSGGRVFAWNPGSSYPSQLRVLSGGRLEVDIIETPPGVMPPEAARPIVFSATQKPGWTRTNTALEVAGFASGRWSGKELWALVCSPNPAELLARHRIPFYLGTARAAASEGR